MAVLTMTDCEVIPTGEYPVECVDVQQDLGKWGEQIRLTLEIIARDTDVFGKRLNFWASLTTALNGKLAKTAAAFGMPLDVGVEFDTDDFMGKKAIAVVVVNTKDDGSEFSKVQEIKAPKRKPAAQPVAQKATDVAKPLPRIARPAPQAEVEEVDVFADD